MKETIENWRISICTDLKGVLPSCCALDDIQHQQAGQATGRRADETGTAYTY